jgi:hypothetical protein
MVGYAVFGGTGITTTTHDIARMVTVSLLRVAKSVAVERNTLTKVLVKAQLDIMDNIGGLVDQLVCDITAGHNRLSPQGRTVDRGMCNSSYRYI